LLAAVLRGENLIATGDSAGCAPALKTLPSRLADAGLDQPAIIEGVPRCDEEHTVFSCLSDSFGK